MSLIRNAFYLLLALAGALGTLLLPRPPVDTSPDASTPQPGNDGGSDGGSHVLDGGAEGGIDASPPGAGEAGARDAQVCPSGRPADTCGVCGGDGASCSVHPLAGTYAVRTQLYAREKTLAGSTMLDLVSKTVLLSVAQIDARGNVKEHYCFVEAFSDAGISLWTAPATVQRVPDTSITLEEHDGVFVRPLAAHHAYFSWSPDAAPSDCVPGAKHASGCTCPTGSGLPTNAHDCRVTDIDSDQLPGGKLYLDQAAPPADPGSSQGTLQLEVVGSLALEWRLNATDPAHVVGAVDGSFEQAELSRSGALSSAFGTIRSAMCPSRLGHVELVKGNFSCDAIMAGRQDDTRGQEIFDATLDSAPPAVEVCTDPDCTVDSDADGTVDCQDGCRTDVGKTAPGSCGCGVPDSDRDHDGTPDCTDACADDPTRVTPGPCGCAACAPSALLGDYAVRTSVFGKQRNNDQVTTSKSLGYSLVSITQNNDGSLRMTARGCWTQSVPNPNESGTKAYSWSKPAWVQAAPPNVRNLVDNGDGTYTLPAVLEHVGWDPARQPTDCNASSTPQQPWASSWGATCTCNAPSSALPPYDHDAAAYDCRLVDFDQDGQPGVSAIASTSPPSSPDASAGLLGGTAYAAVDALDSWLLHPASNGKHSALIDDRANAMVVGCSGLACSALGSAPPSARSCPPALNHAQFVPVTASSDTCAEVIAARDTLFATDQDGAWPDATACPPP